MKATTLLTLCLVTILSGCATNGTSSGCGWIRPITNYDQDVKRFSPTEYAILKHNEAWLRECK